MVREVIVNGLADPESKIRVVSAYVVSKIAHDDFPEDWPNLLDILIVYLKSNSADSVHGAMRVLLEMVKKDISIQQLPQVGPVLLPELYRILTSDNVSRGTLLANRWGKELMLSYSRCTPSELVAVLSTSSVAVWKCSLRSVKKTLRWPISL